MPDEKQQSNSSIYERSILLFEISSALWVHIVAFETTLREFLHDSLSTIYKRNDWWFYPKLLNKDELASIRKTLLHLEPGRLEIKPILVVHNMSFSFWIKLLSKRYHQKIWMKIINLFPVYPGRRDDFYKKAREIRNLRNAIAHHGPILRRNLIRDNEYLHELTAKLDPQLADEVQKRSRVLDLLLNARLVGSGGGI